MMWLGKWWWLILNKPFRYCGKAAYCSPIVVIFVIHDSDLMTPVLVCIPGHYIILTSTTDDVFINGYSGIAIWWALLFNDDTCVCCALFPIDGVLDDDIPLMTIWWSPIIDDDDTGITGGSWIIITYSYIYWHSPNIIPRYLTWYSWWRVWWWWYNWYDAWWCSDIGILVLCSCWNDIILNNSIPRIPYIDTDSGNLLKPDDDDIIPLNLIFGDDDNVLLLTMMSYWPLMTWWILMTPMTMILMTIPHTTDRYWCWWPFDQRIIYYWNPYWWPVFIDDGRDIDIQWWLKRIDYIIIGNLLFIKWQTGDTIVIIIM